MVLPIAALLAAAAVAASAPLPPKVVSSVTVTANPRKAPPADVTVGLDSNSDSPDPQRVTMFPGRAWVRGARGHVTLTCRVGVHGLAEQCRVAYESPEGMGFGAAALAQQALLRVPPKIGQDGQPVPADMNIALVFKQPVKQDNINDLQRIYRGFELPGNKVNIVSNPVATRQITMMNQPTWAAAPGFDDLAAAYPSDADGREGYTVVHCQVARRTGGLSHCFVAKEDPIAHGFAAAALGLARKFRVSRASAASAPMSGLVEVDIPIRFAPAAELAERAVTAPTWLARFDAARVLKLFPPEAADKGLVSGRGIARCVVGADGSLGQCTPGPAEPAGLGFSEAAVKLAPELRMNLWSADAAPVQGGVVEVPIRLNLAEAK